SYLCLLWVRCSPMSTLFPYTTLFRSQDAEENGEEAGAVQPRCLDQRIRNGHVVVPEEQRGEGHPVNHMHQHQAGGGIGQSQLAQDRKSTRLNSSHVKISYAVFCLKKK